MFWDFAEILDKFIYSRMFYLFIAEILFIQVFDSYSLWSISQSLATNWKMLERSTPRGGF